MTPKAIPKTIRVYQLIKMNANNGLTFSMANPVSTPNLGQGIFLSEQDAEQYRTIEILKDSTCSYHVFELEFPNPAYKPTES